MGSVHIMAAFYNGSHFVMTSTQIYAPFFMVVEGMVLCVKHAKDKHPPSPSHAP